MIKFIVIFLIFLVVFVIAVTLGSQNNQVVSFNYLIANGEYRLSSLLAVLFGGGFVIAWIIAGIFYMKARIQLSSSRRKIKKLQQQLIDIKKEITNRDAVIKPVHSSLSTIKKIPKVN